MKYFSPQEVAEQLGVTKKTVYKWLKSRELSADRAGHKWRITQADVDAFTKGQRGANPGYTRRHPWGGYTIRKTDTGFLVEAWSARQGELTDTAHLLPYGTLDMGPDTDLAAEYNEFGTYGMALYHALREGAPAKVIRQGREVE